MLSSNGRLFFAAATASLILLLPPMAASPTCFPRAFFLTLGRSVLDVMELMVEKNFRHVPVVSFGAHRITPPGVFGTHSRPPGVGSITPLPVARCLQPTLHPCHAPPPAPGK
jgi:hypothetical protein